jgi:dihydroxy-acid dehydratase
MEDFYYAGGLPGLIEQIRDRCCISMPHGDGQTLGENVQGAEIYNDDVIRSRSPTRSIQGRRARRAQGQPRARRLRHQAQRLSPKFLKHTGPALVFDDYPSMKARDRPRRSRRHEDRC